MRRHTSFEWDRKKARVNQRKHRVAFETAAFVLADSDGSEFHIELFDADHSDDEERWITIASIPSDRSLVLAISWCERGKATRIISARKATPSERSLYARFLA